MNTDINVQDEVKTLFAKVSMWVSVSSLKVIEGYI